MTLVSYLFLSITGVCIALEISRGGGGGGWRGGSS